METTSTYISHARACDKCCKSVKRHLICVMHSQGCGKMHISETNAIKRPQMRCFPGKWTRYLSLQISYRFRGKINLPCGNTVIQNYLYRRKIFAVKTGK